MENSKRPWEKDLSLAEFLQFFELDYLTVDQCAQVVMLAKRNTLNRRQSEFDFKAITKRILGNQSNGSLPTGEKLTARAFVHWCVEPPEHQRRSYRRLNGARRARTRYPEVSELPIPPVPRDSLGAATLYVNASYRLKVVDLTDIPIEYHDYETQRQLDDEKITRLESELEMLRPLKAEKDRRRKVNSKNGRWGRRGRAR